MKLANCLFFSRSFLCLFLFSSGQAVRATSFLEVVTIFSRYLKNPSQVGEIAPLSKASGVELARFVSSSVRGENYTGKRYLEAGGGCGATSICIAQAMHPLDSLDVIEIDPDMCVILKQRLAGFKNVSVHCCSILDWKPQSGYDGIISTLPFNSLGVGFTAQAIAYFKAVANDLCMFSYVEYPIVRQAVQHFYSSNGKREFQEVQKFMDVIRKKYLVDQITVYRNVPPITIYHLCLKP
jgi:phospholipid N-methyltransferase